MCARQGLLRPGLVAIDGTKMVANASKEANRTAEQVAEQILAEAAAIDAAEDADESRRPSRAVPEDVAAAGGRRGPGCARLLDELEGEAAEQSYEAHMARRAENEAETGKTAPGKPPSPDRQTHSRRQHAQHHRSGHPVDEHQGRVTCRASTPRRSPPRTSS